jgi:hypothetical protein
MNTVDRKIEALTNSLRYFNIPDKYFIQSSDKRLGHKFVIASKGELGGLHSHSNYMSYEEMNAYLMGYNAALTKPLS